MGLTRSGYLKPRDPITLKLPLLYPPPPKKNAYLCKYTMINENLSLMRCNICGEFLQDSVRNQRRSWNQLSVNVRDLSRESVQAPTISSFSVTCAESYFHIIHYKLCIFDSFFCLLLRLM